MSKDLGKSKMQLQKKTTKLENAIDKSPIKKLKQNDHNDQVQSSKNDLSDQDTDMIEEQNEDEISPKVEQVKSENKESGKQNKVELNGQKKLQKEENKQQEQTKSTEKEQQKGNNKITNIEQKKTLRSQTSKMKNLQFYLNHLQSTPNGDYIENILTKWRGNFKLLETHHGYVQWLFPNFFQSRFNGVADALLKEEADEFIKNPQIALRLRKSYELIYEFFGMKITNNLTGHVERADNYQERQKETFIANPHNLMRIRRILCHFNNVGFRRYSIALVKFLEKEIYGDLGYKNFAEDKRPLVIKLQELPQTGPLRSLARLKTFEDWNVYGEIDESNINEVETLQDNCFATLSDIKRESIYFDSLKK